MNRIADKAALRGMKSLSDEELLTLLVEDEQLARTLLSACGGSPARLAVSCRDSPYMPAKKFMFSNTVNSLYSEKR